VPPAATTGQPPAATGPTASGTSAATAPLAAPAVVAPSSAPPLRGSVNGEATGGSTPVGPSALPGGDAVLDQSGQGTPASAPAPGVAASGSRAAPATGFPVAALFGLSAAGGVALAGWLLFPRLRHGRVGPSTRRAAVRVL
ncbi:MAG: hypothetical protein JWN61_3241, partial [Pseudonocardiales bacterium]|nr:hypothetical protein [Pseudonocardiales bacterium]